MGYQEEKYTISVEEDRVEIRGTLTIQEALDYLNFYQDQGYTTIEDGYDVCALYLRRRNLDQEKRDWINKETLEELDEVKKNYDDEKKRTNELENRVKDLEYLIKKIALDDKEKNDQFKKANEQLARFKALEKLKDSPEAAKICAMEGPGSESEDLANFEGGGTVE